MTEYNTDKSSIINNDTLLYNELEKFGYLEPVSFYKSQRWTNFEQNDIQNQNLSDKKFTNIIKTL